VLWQVTIVSKDLAASIFRNSATKMLPVTRWYPATTLHTFNNSEDLDFSTRFWWVEGHITYEKAQLNKPMK
jgi:hypothetical protein